MTSSARWSHALVASPRRRWLAAAVVVLAVALTAVLFSRSPSPRVDETVDWETRDVSQTTGLECPSSSKDFSIVSSPVRQGSYAARFHIDGGSALWGNGIPRCMYTLYDSHERVGDDYYYGFSVYIPSPLDDEVIWELHAPAALYNISPNCSIAPLAVQASNGGFDLRIDSGNCDGVGWDHYEPHIAIPGLAAQPLNRWIDFVIHVKFAESNGGMVELWQRVARDSWPSDPNVARYDIATMPYSHAARVNHVRLYQEMGLYPGSEGYSGDDTLITDEFRRGTSFGAVAPD